MTYMHYNFNSFKVNVFNKGTFSKTNFSETENWGELVASDLIHPKFKITRLQAFRSRLMRNYATLYVVLLIAWIAKLGLVPIEEGQSFIRRLDIGYVSGYIPLVLVSTLYLFLIMVVIFVPSVETAALEDWETDHAAGHIKDF